MQVKEVLEVCDCYVNLYYKDNYVNTLHKDCDSINEIIDKTVLQVDVVSITVDDYI